MIHKVRIYTDYTINAKTGREARRKTLNMLYRSIEDGSIKSAYFSSTMIKEKKKMILSLKQKDIIIGLKKSFNTIVVTIDGWYLMGIHKNGTIIRGENILPELGFKLDKKGRVRIRRF